MEFFDDMKQSKRNKKYFQGDLITTEVKQMLSMISVLNTVHVVWSNFFI